MESGVILTCHVEADSYSMLRNLVMGGNDWTVLPPAAIAADVAAGRLKAAPFARPIRRRIEVGHSPERPLTQMGSFTLAKLTELTADLVRSGRWPHSRLIR